jgi:hypothetical protein
MIILKTYMALLLALFGLAFTTARASAEVRIPAYPNSPGWMINSHSYPTNLPPGGGGAISVDVYDVGAAPSSPGAIVTDTLPVALTAVSQEETRTGLEWRCSRGSPVTCEIELPSVTVEQEEQVTLKVSVEAGAAEGKVPNAVTVSGGGAPNPASAAGSLMIRATPASFGFADADGWFTNADGTVDTQAGSHPYEVTFDYDLNTDGVNSPAEREESRNIEVNLPPGLIGNPTAVPQCPRYQFDDQDCPAATQIGRAAIGLVYSGETRPFTPNVPVYNLVPPIGTPAEFAFTIQGQEAFLDAAVRSGGDYGITEHIYNAPQREIVRSRVTLWGVPGDPSHDPERCENIEGSNTCGVSSSAARTPFLTLPTACTGAQPFSITSNTWANPNASAGYEFFSHDSNGTLTGITGCDHLGFGPAITVAPETTQADTPAGLTVEVKVPQEGLLSTEGLSTSNIENTTVTLPNGLVINPGQASGLQACQPSEAGVASGEGPGDEGPPSCPSASKVGTDEIETPLLASALKGSVYVLQSNPPNLKLLVSASGEGVNLKLVGDVHLDEATGQLTTTFTETPELPFTDFKLSFSGGAQAALATPTTCGVYAAASDFMPWSTPAVQNVFSENAFAIDSGPGGSDCASPLPFGPSLTAGSTTDQAGGFTDFSLLLQRGDGQQRIDGLQFKAPPGLTGMLSKVPLCTNVQAEANACPEASKIGHTVIESGPGPYPLVVPEPGHPPAPIYLTESYDGAPFGLSIVVPLNVGPFTLETQRVRARIEVDPHTAQITVTTNPLPQLVDGVPTDLREVDAVIERPEFMVNPTNCDPSEFSGTAYGTPPPGQGGPGASAPISSAFQVGSCRSLEFAPKFSVSTSGHTSKADGADLIAKVAYPPAPQGTQADIAKFKVDLPKQLPSRLTTLQKACTDAQFEANPAGCPSGSFIGHAVVHTPVLPVPLQGPAVFVSHGGEAFPALTLVLQGDGVTIDLVGSTFISKAGITSTTFQTVPDAAFSTFELTLPEGRYSALAANGNLCTSKLAMPTAIVGQNGAEIHESTPISITGCAKAQILTRAQKLVRALKSCRMKSKGKRAGCEKKARKKYAPAKAAAKTKHNQH